MQIHEALAMTCRPGLGRAAKGVTVEWVAEQIQLAPATLYQCMEPSEDPEEMTLDQKIVVRADKYGFSVSNETDGFRGSDPCKYIEDVLVLVGRHLGFELEIAAVQRVRP